MPAPDFMPDDNWNRPVVGRATPARGVPIVRESRLSDHDIERIQHWLSKGAKPTDRVLEVMKALRDEKPA